MTLIVGSIGKCSAILASDRRLSSGGIIVDDESTKLTFVTTPNARMAMAYTGLARINRFSTEEWLLDTFNLAADKATSIDELLEEVRMIASEQFNSVRLNTRDAYLTIVLLGFKYSEKVEPVIYRLSNFEYGGTDGNFSMVSRSLEDEAIITVAGNTVAVNQADLEVFRKLVSKDLIQAGEIKAYEIIKKAGLSKSSRNTVGLHANVSFFTSEVNTPLTSVYYADSLTHVCYGANSVIIGSKKALLNSMGVQLKVPSQFPAVVVPKTNRNYPCSCGSGIRYKNCHGKINYPYMDLVVNLELDGQEFKSGKKFFIVGKGAY